MWDRVPSALAAVPDWTGRVLNNATNRFKSMNPLRLGDIYGNTSSDVIS